MKLSVLFPGLLHELRERDPELLLHLRLTAALVLPFGSHLGLPPEDLEVVLAAAWLHDLGKLLLPAGLRRRKGRLGRSGWELMRLHPVLGAGLLASRGVPERIVRAVMHHHERWDGKGYPEGLRGEGIPFEARVLSVVDAAAAMVELRSYRASEPDPLEISGEVLRNAGRQFDPEIAREFASFWGNPGSKGVVEALHGGRERIA